MICAYCNLEKKATKEHIIPKGIIDLFPECNIAYSELDKAYRGEATIKDVCSECNNGYLSELDTYGKNFIEKYFMENFEIDKKLRLNMNIKR